MKLIKRDDYIARLDAIEGTPDIKILSLVADTTSTLQVRMHSCSPAT